MGLKSLSAACCALLFAASLSLPALAEEAMSSSAMAGDAMPDPMATECLMKAQAESDVDKMQTMVGDCHKMYPEDMAATCLSEAMMEMDSAKMEMMVQECHQAHPESAMNAMSGAM